MQLINKSTNVLLPSLRISFALVLITISLLLVADLLNFVPSERRAELRARKVVSEFLATQFSSVGAENIKLIYKSLSILVKRDNDILSAGVRNPDRQLIFSVGNHAEQWGDFNSEKSTATNLVIPLRDNGKLWATVELKYKVLATDAFAGFFGMSIYKLIIYIMVFGFFAYLLFILRIRRLLDPSAVIPDRVSAAFDTLEEGVLILDKNEQIVLANKAFATKLERSQESLIGVKASELQWKVNV